MSAAGLDASASSAAFWSGVRSVLSYLQALVGERDSYLKTGGLAPLTNNQRYIQWRMLLLNGKGCTGAG